MSYIGRQNLGGAYRQLDDISSGFDGSDTTHTMQVNSQNVTVGDVNQIILSLGGVIQKPGTDFTVSGSVLTFTTAPASGLSFFAIILGSDNGGTVTPTDGSVTNDKISSALTTIAGLTSAGAAGTATSIAGIPFYKNDTGSVYTHDVSGTDSTANYNTAFGIDALDAITTGDNNTVVGSGAGGGLTTGHRNTLMGQGAGILLTEATHTVAIGNAAASGYDTETNNLAIGHVALGGSVAGGEYNIAIGNYALDALTSGDRNTVVGYQAATALTTSNDNVIMGYNAAENATTLLENVVIGHEACGAGVMTAGYGVYIGKEAGLSKTSGGSNVFIGYQSGEQCTTTARSIFIGSTAGDDHDTENDNIGIGNAALGGSIAGGEENVCIGRDTGSALTSGDHSTLIGYQAGAAVTTGNHTVAVGYQTGYNDQITGNGNTLLGNYAGFRLTSGNENTIVGYDAGTLITTGTNNTCLGRDAGGPNSPSSLSSDDHTIVLGDSNITALICNDTSISSSDSRDKTDVENFTHGLNYIEQLRPVTYRWDKRAWYVDKLGKDMTNDDVKNAKPDGSRKKNKINVGFLAQEVQAIEEALGYKASEESNLVFNDNDGFQYGLKYERLVPMLVNAIKELSAKVKALEEA